MRSENEIRLEALQMALEEIEKIIDSMHKNNYTNEEINEYNKKRWDIWNEMYKVKNGKG